MDKLTAIVDQALDDLKGTLNDEQTAAVSKAIEAAVIRGLLEGQHRAVDACRSHTGVHQDIAHHIADTIRQKNDALIVNLASLR